MNLKKMMARVYRALPNLPPGSVGADDIVNYLNEGLDNLSKMSIKTTLLKYDLEDNVDSVPFPEDMLKIVNVYWSDEKKELEISKDRMAMDDGTDKGDPTTCYIEDGRITLRPIPDRDSSLFVMYTRKPTPLKEDNDTPDIDGSEEYIIAYALYRLHLEANSPSFQIWDMVKTRELADFMDTYNENYASPFRVIASW